MLVSLWRPVGIHLIWEKVLWIFLKIAFCSAWMNLRKKKKTISSNFVTIFQRVNKDCFRQPILFVKELEVKKKKKFRSNLVKKFTLIGWVLKGSLKLTSFCFFGSNNYPICKCESSDLPKLETTSYKLQATNFIYALQNTSQPICKFL